MASSKEFKIVQEELKGGKDLTFDMVGRVFGQDFWMLITYSLMDAQDAARAIQGAIARLSAQPLAQEVD